MPNGFGIGFNIRPDEVYMRMGANKRALQDLRRRTETKCLMKILNSLARILADRVKMQRMF